MSQAVVVTSPRQLGIIPDTILIATAAQGTLAGIDNSAVLYTPASCLLA